MGLEEQLTKIYTGLRDIFTAPVGLIVDSAKAITSPTYNPGFFGVFGESTSQLIGGLGTLGSGFGFDEVGRAVGSESGFGLGIKNFFDESERIYSSEFQRETGLAPIGLRDLGVQPGEVSLQRVGATFTGLSGSLVGATHGGDPLNAINFYRSWQKAAHRTPGQAWIEDAIYPDFYTKVPEEQNEIRESAEYNLVSGSIDAVMRWYTDPFIIAGKGYKAARQQFRTFAPDKDGRFLRTRPKTHTKSLKDLGYTIKEELVGPDGLPMVRIGAGSETEVISVVRGRQLNQMKGEGLSIADDAIDARVALYSDEEIQAVRSIAKDAGVPESELDTFVDMVLRSDAGEVANTKSASSGILGRKAKSTPTKRYIGTQHRPLQLFSAANEEEALRYAAALYAADPTDMPVLLRMKADDLPVVFEEYDLATLPNARDYNPNDANFLTLAEEAADHIDEVVRLDPSDLDPALNLGGAPSHLGPSGRLSNRLYHPDGTPIEPDQISRIDTLIEEVKVASKLEDPIQVEKFLEHRRTQRNLEGVKGDVLAVRAANHKVVQAHLNWIDNKGKGRSMDDIRRVLFPNTPFGEVIANMLSEATTYMDRRSILMASMGYKSTGFTKLEPMLRLKLEKLLQEQARISSGKVPSELVNEMLGVKTRYTDSAAPYMDDLVKELVDEVEDLGAFTSFLNRISDMAPVRQVIMPYGRRGANVIRKTAWYQESTMTRPMRAITENRPGQWVNLADPMTDRQVVRQMDDARGFFTKDEVAATRKEYATATNEQAREVVLNRMNNQILDRAAKRAKMTPEEFEKLLESSRAGTGRARQILNSRRYGTNDMMRIVDEETGIVEHVAMPFLSTQTRSWYPMPNAKEIAKQANKIGKLRARIPGAELANLLDIFYRVWKPTVLLRGGWMIRVVSDEQLRILAKTGSLFTHIAAIAEGEAPAFTSMFKAKLKPGQPSMRLGQRAGAVAATATGTQPLTALTVRASRVIDRVSKKLGLVNPRVRQHMKSRGVEGMVSARASHGGPSEATLRNLQALIGRDELMYLNHLYDKGTGQWQSITRGEENFGPAWARVLTHQYGKDPLGRRVIQEVLERKLFDLDAIDPEDLAAITRNLKKYLTDTAEGREMAERMIWRSRDPDKWIEELIEELNGYTAGFDETLLRGSLDGKVTTKMMEAIDERFRPDTVHAEIVDQTLGTSGVSRFVGDFISETFDLLGRLPTDTLSRQPFFKELYAGEMVRLERIRAAQGLNLTEDAIGRMNTAARQFAINEVKEFLYDLAEVSRFGYMIRHIAPFYPAWQEIFTVWGKIALEDPSVIGRARLLWQAPNKAGMVYTDDDGEDFIAFRLSEQAAENLNLTGWQEYIATGGARFGKQSFNLILNNPLPGVGPPIQYPVNEIVKKKPELEHALRWLLPFGVTTDNSTIMFSPLIRQLKKELQGESGDRAQVRAFIDAVTWMDVQYRLGERTTPPTEEEAHDIASKLNIMRFITRLMAPAQPIFDSPLQPYIDIYRDMQDNLGEEAHETFLNEYGTELFAVTLSRSVSATGIPPTVEGEVARRQFEELIEQYPEYGRLIVGDAALGEFSTAAYAAQLERKIDPDNPFSEVERTSREIEIDPRTGGIIEVDRRLGWDEYIKAMDVLDLERQKRGLPNLRVKEAESLAAAKTAVTEMLRNKYPSWWEDFNTRDSLKWPTRIAAFRTITKNPVTSQRADIQGLEDYLEARQVILQELNRRKMSGGSSTLNATANTDLQFVWDSAVFTLLDQNIVFGPLYYRYLEGDPVELR